MKPIKLTMQAFGSYGNKTSIDFTAPNQNLFLITGDTGAGKTTIFDAVVFALYGEASSENNRKKGEELQSQFSDYSVEPYVELVFSERTGEEERTYTVKRVPKHLRAKKRGDGSTGQSEKVALTMPDGTIYPQKETNKKLEEIIGLTKSQFMQVAMIAQGEFMEFLRARSEDKKVIFRKLFNTELYQKIVDELGKRSKEKEENIKSANTRCASEAGHAVIPKDYEGADELEALKNEILSSNRTPITDMERFQSELLKMCKKLEISRDESKARYDEAAKIRDIKRDEFTRAQTLIKSFEQLEDAQSILKDCDEHREEMIESRSLMEKISAAYEIKSVYERYNDARNAVAKTTKDLNEQNLNYPGLENKYKEADKAEKELKTLSDAELEKFTKVSEKVNKAREIFNNIKIAQKDLDAKKTALKNAEKNDTAAKEKLKELESKENEWKEQRERLSGAEKALSDWNIKNDRLNVLLEDMGSVNKAKKAVDDQKKKVEAAKKAYLKARDEYSAKNDEYVMKRNIFLDAQAGFIAMEKLKPGQPCPVCGSLDHPSPCELSDEHKDITREIVDALAAEAADLQKKQQDKAAAASSAAESLKEKTKAFDESFTNLKDRMRKAGLKVEDEADTVQAGKIINEWKRSIDDEKDDVHNNAQQLKEVQELLNGVDDERNKLKEKIENAASALVDAKTALAGSEAALNKYLADKEYEDEAAAEKEYQEAEESRNEVNDSYTEAVKAAKAAKKARDNAEALIQKYNSELPELKNAEGERSAEYKSILSEKAMEENEWKEIVEAHEKTEAEDIRKSIDDYNKTRSEAQGKLQSAKEAIGDQKKPDIKALEEQKNEAENDLESIKNEYEKYREDYKTNTDVYDKLGPIMAERNKLAAEYTKVNSLYNRLAGKVSGARMDIETFVQRYYLQRILYAANKRFQNMSAGQYELRIVNENMAGEGRNRGLDLMVYSDVTGKEREVRTLSGGESFMAALSLALGMADTINERSAAINLDIMFIDEGFGSLDEHSRNQAVKVLQQMAGDSKLIGIISHVTELKQEIEDQLIVSKDEDGSHVRWQIS